MTTQSTDEGVGSILRSKVLDLAKGFILKPRPIVILYSAVKDEVASFKIKRGVIQHSLIKSEGDIDSTVLKSSSTVRLLESLLSRVKALKSAGFVEL